MENDCVDLRQGGRARDAVPGRFRGVLGWIAGPQLKAQYAYLLPKSVDPIWRPLSRLTRCQSYWVIIIGLVLHGAFLIGGGYAITTVYRLPSGGMLDWREAISAFYVYLIFCPGIWYLYWWQPKGIIETIATLAQQGVIVPKRPDTEIGSFIRRQILPVLNARICSVAATLLFFIAVLVASYALQAENFINKRGMPLLWFQVDHTYYYYVWLPFQLVIVYMLAFIIVRQACAIVAFKRTFESCAFHPKPFHPDQANGLGSVGDYTMRTTSCVVLIAFWIVNLVCQPLLFGSRFQFTEYTALLIAVYVLAVPTLLILPVWWVHVEMARARNRALEEVATAIREQLVSESAEMATRMAAIKELEKMYQLVANEYKTWPFASPGLRSFSITALTPFIPSAIALWSQLQKRP